MGKFSQAKKAVLNYFEALESCKGQNIEQALAAHVSADYEMRSVYPFREIEGGLSGAVKTLWQPMTSAIKHMERRQDIFIAGDNQIVPGEVWVMSMGHFMGLHDETWLGIRPTGKIVNIPYAEFNCVENGKVTKTALLMDLISFMAQAGVYPLAPMTGKDFVFYGPKRHNGLLFEDAPEQDGKDTLALVNRMCDDLVNGGLVDAGDGSVTGTPEEIYGRTFAPNMAWYGSCGIGGTYTIPRYMKQHQGPFSDGLTDMRFNGHMVRFAEGNFACWFGWPNLYNRNSGGYLGMNEGKEAVQMQVVDVYSCYDGFIEENWVFIDLAWWLKQQGMDVFERTTEIFYSQY